MKVRLKEGIFKLLERQIAMEDIQDHYVWFVHDEIEGETFPDYVLEVLADPIMTSSVSYENEERDRYEICHLYYCGPNP